MRMRKCVLRVLAVLLMALSGTAPLRADDKPYVVLALSGGGIKGYAHIGVLEVLEREGIGVAGVVGTSMGSIIGSLYASGRTPSEMAQMVNDINLGALVTATGGNYFSLSDRSSQDVSMLRPELHMNDHNEVVGPLGLVSGTAVLDYLANLLSNVTVTDFSKLPIPFACVATDLVSGEKVVLRNGSLASAVRASMSIPGVFDPWEVNGRLLVDGGMVSNMPVETARELFPGYPVIAVNLTSELEPRENLGAMLDVLNQSITILTMQNVRREATLADLVINPGVREYPMLGTTPAAEIVDQGRVAAEKMLPQIRKLLENAPRRPIKPKVAAPSDPRIVEVEVTGVPAKMAANLERELSKRWLGHRLDMKEIVAAASSLAKREDVRSVDYDLRETERGVVVVMKVQRMPAHIYSVGGYANTLAGLGQLKVEGKSYDLMKQGDTLQSRFYLSNYWGADFKYFWGMNVDRTSFWEAGLSATHFKIDAENSASQLDWQRYAIDLQRHFTLHDRVRLSVGGTLAAVRRVEGGDSANYFAPFVEARVNLMDDPDDPVNGLRLLLRATWMNDADEMLLRTNLVARRQLGKNLVAELQGGYVDGDDEENPLYAAYLGSREELYSLAQHPIRSERFAWWRAKLRYPLTETMFGPVTAEIFGGQGYAWDHESSLFRQPWEAGVALVTPRKLIEARAYAVYTDRDEWKFGVSIGVPDWDVFHLF